MTTLEKRKYIEHSPEAISAALLQCALDGGNTRRAARKLKQRGITVSRPTLYKWITTTHHERYKTFAEENAREIEESLVVQQRELALLGTQVAHQSLEKQQEQLDNGEVKDPSTVARNAQTVAGIATDKIMDLTGRPRMVIEHKHVDEILRGLASKGMVADSTAEEIEDAEVVADLPSLPAEGLATEPEAASQRVPVDTEQQPASTTTPTE